MSRSLRLGTILMSLVVLTSACGGGGDQAMPGTDSGVKVVATTSIWADIASAATCGRIKVPSLIPAGVDAHSFEPTVRDAERLGDADVILANGLELEHDMSDALSAAEKSGASLVELGPDADPIGKDPHVWMDPDRVAKVVPTIEKALAEVLDTSSAPVSRAELKACGDEYVKKLHNLSREMGQKLSVVPEGSRSLVTNHESLGYFADRFDFKILGALIPSSSTLGESDPRTLHDLVNAMKTAHVRAVFAETTGSHELANALSDQLGEPVDIVDLFTESLGDSDDDGTYLKMMETNADRIANALSQ